MDDISETHVQQTAVYKRRWLILFIVAILNTSNGALWINFAPITNLSASYFKVSNNSIDWFSIVFFVTTIITMLVALFIIDKYGFKVGVQTGCAFNMLGSIVRLVGTQNFIPAHYRFIVTLGGQCLTSFAQPFAMALPTKVSELWFPEEQRTISTSMCAMGNPLGFMLGSLLSPILVNVPQDIPKMNSIFCGFGIVVGTLGIFVWSDKPQLPPSISANKEPNVVSLKSYLSNLKKLIMNKHFIVLQLAVGGGIGLVSALQTMLGQSLCSWGYTSNFAGICGALMVAGGLSGAAIFSIVATKLKSLEEISKIGYSISIIITIILYLVFRMQNVAYLIAILSTLLGFTAIGIYPICLELGVETTYPIDEAISTGIIVVNGQIQGAILVPLMSILAQPVSGKAALIQKCEVEGATEALDMTYSGLFLAGVGAIWTALFLMIFRAKYNRAEVEKMKNNSTQQLPREIDGK